MTQENVGIVRRIRQHRRRRKLKIRAPIWRCYETAADVERMPEWHESLVGVEVLKRDFKGRPDVVDLVAEVTVSPVILNLHFSYEPPNDLSWEGEVQLPQGDSRARGRWNFEELGDRRTRAILTYDFGRHESLGEGMVLGIFVGHWANGLRDRVEGRQKPDPAAWLRMSDEEFVQRQRDEQSRLR